MSPVAVDVALDAVRRELGPIEIMVTSAGIDAGFITGQQMGVNGGWQL